MDWKKFLQSLIDAKNKFLTDANAALKPLPPIEQHDASTAVGFAIREMNSAFQWITTTCMRLDSDLQELIGRGNQIIADLNKAHVEELVTKGDLIPKSKIDSGDYLSKEVAQSSAQAAAEAAANERETAVRGEIKLLASRRVELHTPKTTMEGVASGGDPKVLEPALLSRDIADKLPDDLLKADDYKEKAGIIAKRLSDINSLGVNVPGLLQRAHELPLDETGDTQFTEQLSSIRTAVDQARGGKKADEPVVRAPFAQRQDAGASLPELAGVF